MIRQALLVAATTTVLVGAARRGATSPNFASFFMHHLSNYRRPNSCVPSRSVHCRSADVDDCPTPNMADETAKAQTASPGDDTIFGKIARGEIKTDFVYEDDQVVAFNDVTPQAPVHVLVIPRRPIVALSKTTDDDEKLLGHLLVACRRVAEKLGLQKGYRLVINDGRHGGQSVYHLHVHILAGRQLAWPPG